MSNLQKTTTFSSPSSHLFGCLAVAALGNLVEHIVNENSPLVLDLVALHFHSHGFSMQVCSGLEVVVGFEIVVFFFLPPTN